MNYKTLASCSKNIGFDMLNECHHHAVFEGGCHGNLQVVGILYHGNGLKEAVTNLIGINGSMRCCYQLTKAIKQVL